MLRALKAWLRLETSDAVSDLTSFLNLPCVVLGAGPCVVGGCVVGVCVVGICVVGICVVRVCVVGV